MTAPQPARTISLRRECECGGSSGKVSKPRGGVHVVRCVSCGRYAFNASRAELGLETPAVSAAKAVLRQLDKAGDDSPAALGLVKAAEDYLRAVRR